MIISVFKKLKIFDIGSKPNVEKLCKELVINDNDVTLDVSRCIIDYPATSILIDKILKSLSLKPLSKTFTIVTNLNILELLLLHWLFIGSNFLGIEDAVKKNSIEEFKALINKKLKPKKIKLIIQVVDKQGNIVKAYNYGE